MLFLLRALLVLALLGLVPGGGPQRDPALAMAQAAGALCLADGPEGLPADHQHEHCLACPGAPAAGGLAEAPVLPIQASDAVALRMGGRRVVPAVGWPPYASRAPPGMAG